MGLSNAERQRRYIRRLKAAAVKPTAKLRIRELEAINEELRRKLGVLHRWHQNEMRKLRDRKKMPDATFRALIKCLHPDQRRRMTPKQIDEACGLLTQWKKTSE
jgi:hypothetical protein